MENILTIFKVLLNHMIWWSLHSSARTIVIIASCLINSHIPFIQCGNINCNAQSEIPPEVSEDIENQIRESEKDILQEVAYLISLHEARAAATRKVKRYRDSFSDISNAIDLAHRYKCPSYHLVDFRIIISVESGMHREAITDINTLLDYGKEKDRTRLLALASLILSRSSILELRNPKLALEYASEANALSETLSSHKHNMYLIEQALASAYAANGQFDKAIFYQELLSTREAKMLGETRQSTDFELKTYRENKIPVFLHP